MFKRILSIFVLMVSTSIILVSCAYINFPLLGKKTEKQKNIIAEEYYKKAMDSEKNGDIYNALSYLKLALAKDPQNTDISNKYTAIIKSLHSDLIGTQEIIKKGSGVTNPVIYKLYRKADGKTFPVQGMPVHFRLINATGKFTKDGITNDVGEAKCYIDKIEDYSNNISIEAYVLIPDNDNGEEIKNLTKSFIFSNTSILDKNVKILLKSNNILNDKIISSISQNLINLLNQEGFTDVSIMPSFNFSLFNKAMNKDKSSIRKLGIESASDILFLLSVDQPLNLQQSFDFYLKMISIKAIIVDSKSGEVYFEGIVEGKGADRTETGAEGKAMKDTLSRFEKILKSYLEEVKIKNEFTNFSFKSQSLTSGS